MEYLLRPSGIMRRTITLSGEWYKDGIGALLCTTEDGSITALIPKGSSGYTFFDKSLGKTVAVNKKNAAIFQAEAMCFYKPFPLKQLTVKDLLQYILGTLSLSDYIAVALATLAVALIGLFTAYANNVIITNVVYSDAPSLLLSAGVLLLGVTLSSVAIRITKSVLLSRVSTKMKVPVESATMMRILSLPASFFKQYSSGDLASRAQNMNVLCNLFTDILLSTGLTTVFSLVYIFQIFSYSKTLALPAVIVLLITVVFAVLSAVIQIWITSLKKSYPNLWISCVALVLSLHTDSLPSNNATELSCWIRAILSKTAPMMN